MIMSNVLFSKFSYNRDKRFQCKTVIIECDDGAKKVEKSSLHEVGIAHIQDIYENFAQLKNLYSSTAIDVALCQKVNNKTIAFPYIEGDSLEDVLDIYLDQNNYDDMISTIRSYFSELESISSSVNFEKSSKFIKVFGDVELDQNLSVITGANLDAIFSNVKVDGSKYVFIDYEWVFDFAIPMDYLKFRCLFWFINSQSRISKLEKLDLYEVFGLSDKIALFEMMEDHYQAYVMGDYIADWKLLPYLGTQVYNLVDFDSAQKRMNKHMQVYEKQQGCFSEDNSFFINYIDHQIDGYFNLTIEHSKQSEELRIDPIEEPCILIIKNLKCNGITLEYTHNGQFLNDNVILYNTSDPFIILKSELDVKCIEFEGICLPIHTSLLNYLNSSFEREDTLNKRIIEYSDGIIELREVIDGLMKTIQTYEENIKGLQAHHDNTINDMKVQSENTINDLTQQYKNKTEELQNVIGEQNSQLLDVNQKLSDANNMLNTITNSRWFKLISWHFKDIL